MVLFSTASTALVEGKLSKNLKKILKKIVAKDAHEQLAVADAKLGGVIKVIIDFPVFLFVFVFVSYYWDLIERF